MMAKALASVSIWALAISFSQGLLPVAVASEPERIGIVLNQLGFQPSGPKRAILQSKSSDALNWKLLDAANSIKAEGKTAAFGLNAASAEHVHIIDFSQYAQAGRGYRLVVDEQESRPFEISADVFKSLKLDALAYFYHNRSGVPIEARYVRDAKWARPAGHAPERVSCFDKKDQGGNQWPGCEYQLDTTGGWYDAGDHGKYVVNAGISVWTLLNYYERAQRVSDAHLDDFADGKLPIPERSNGHSDLLDEVRWELNFLLGMQAPEGAKLRMPRQPANEPPQFVQIDVSGMAHHKVHGEQWTALPSAPHMDTEPRYAYPPSTTATLNLAATAAQCARIWRKLDPVFSQRCLDAAQRAYDAALREPNLLPIGGFSGGGGYGDRDASDEFYWAAAELFITTGEERYARDLRASPHFLAAPQSDGRGQMSWSSVSALGTISLAMMPNNLNNAERERARSNLVAAAELYAREAQQEGYAIPYSSDRYEWGSNSAVLNNALVLGIAHDLTGRQVFRDRLIDALDYVLGRNPLDQSYVSGYGANPMRNPHHRFWAHQKDSGYPPPPPGALSGGPNSSNMIDPIAKEMKGACVMQTCWKDHIDAYALNEVAINWNAPLFWVAAFADERLAR
jgi:endoglucanase